MHTTGKELGSVIACRLRVQGEGQYSIEAELVKEYENKATLERGHMDWKRREKVVVNLHVAYGGLFSSSPSLSGCWLL